AFSIFAFIGLQMSRWWQKLSKWNTIVFIIMSLLTLVLPLEKMIAIQFIHNFLITSSILLALGVLFYTALKQMTESVILLFSFIAFTSNSVWYYILVLTGMKVVYYPFDLIVTMACFAIVSFRK